MRGVSGVVYLVSLIGLFVASSAGQDASLLVVASIVAAVWLSLDIKGVANRAHDHLLEITSLLNVGLLLVFGALTLGGAPVPFFLAGIASVIHGVGFIEARNLGVVAQTVGIFEAASGACFIAGIPLVGAAIALPTTVLKVLVLGSERPTDPLEDL